MSHTDDDKFLLNMLLGASNGLQMVTLVSHNSDEHLDSLEKIAEKALVDADDDLGNKLRERLSLLRSVREQQSEVIYLRFEGANNTQQLEAFAFELEENGIRRLERIVNSKMSGAPPETAVMLSDKLRQVIILRSELKPIKDGIFRFLAANLDEAREVLVQHKDLLLTETAQHELSLVDSSDPAVRSRIAERRKLWNRVYAEHTGQPIPDDVVEEDIEPSKPAAVSPAPVARQPAAVKPGPEQPDVDVDEADRLMDEVYGLLDQAIGNAMVAFGIYRKSKSTRADEALKLLTSIHNEATKSDEKDD